MLTISILGATQILNNDRPLTIKRRRSRALLFYLAAHDHPISRDQLIGLLWPDLPAASARHNLRSTVYALRQQLGEHMQAEEDLLALAEGVRVDVRDFEAALSATSAPIAALESALGLYRGDLLADFAIPDAPEYEDWMAVAQEHYRRMAIRGFQALSRLHEADGQFKPALAALERALRIDPFQEDVQRAALRLHYLSGDRAGAIRRFDDLRRMLAEEMGAPPMAETQALYDAIITDQLPVPARPDPVISSPTPSRAAAPSAATFPPPLRTAAAGQPAALPFIGRAALLADLERLRTTPKLILIEGEPGIGKTRLAQRTLRIDGSGQPAGIVLLGRAHDLESRMPYQPIIDALRNLTHAPSWPEWRRHLDLPDLWWVEVARLVPELRGTGDRPPAGPAPDESRLWEGVHQLLAALAQRYPLTVFLDDLHWSDSATLGLLGYLVRRAAAESVHITFLAASHPVAPRTELSALLQTLIREDLLARMRLDRFSVAEVNALAQAISPRFGYPLGSWLYRGSEGNPYILVELIRYARAGRILAADGVVDLSALPVQPVVPQTVYTLIQARLDALSEPARRVLDAAVAVGREFEYEVAARAAALSDAAALDAVDELRRERLIHPMDDMHFAFDHSLIMEVAYREVGELRHRSLHRRVAAAIETIHRDNLDEVAGLLAEHYAEGQEPVLAANYARRAGERAVRLAAWREAAGYFRQALEGGAEEERVAVLTALGNAYLHAGEIDLAVDALEQALRLAQSQNKVSAMPAVLQGLAEALIMQARYRDVIRLAEGMARYAESEVRYAIEYIWGIALSLEGIDLQGAIDHLLAAQARLGQAPDSGSAIRLAQIEFELGNIDARRGLLQEAITRYRKVYEITAAQTDDEMLRWHVMAHNNLAYHLHLAGDPEALALAQQGLALAREKGMLTLLPYLGSTLGEIALAQDDVATAESHFSRALAEARRMAQPERIAGLTANLGLAAQRRGRTDQAIQYLTEALSVAEAAHSPYLATQIRLWLAPLAPKAEADSLLAAARALIEGSQFYQLRDQLEQVTVLLADETPRS